MFSTELLNLIYGQGESKELLKIVLSFVGSECSNNSRCPSNSIGLKYCKGIMSIKTHY